MVAGGIAKCSLNLPAEIPCGPFLTKSRKISSLVVWARAAKALTAFSVSIFPSVFHISNIIEMSVICQPGCEISEVGELFALLSPVPTSALGLIAIAERYK